MTEIEMKVKRTKIVKNVQNVAISDLSVFIWLNDGSRIEVYSKDIEKLRYIKVS